MTYSAIIVLGNWMDQHACLQLDSAARMDLALTLLHEHPTAVLVTSGWAYRDDTDITIAEAMKTYAIERGGVSSNAILTETTARDTVGDAVFTKRNVVLAAKIPWDKLLLVTSDYHVQRVQEIFNFVYGSAYSITVVGADSQELDPVAGPAAEAASIAAFRKTFAGIAAGDDAAIYQRLCEQHPFYNGQVHPQIERLSL